jgi:hypothetical protein
VSSLKVEMAFGNSLEKSYLDLSSNLLTNLRFDPSFVINVILVAGLKYGYYWAPILVFGSLY